MRTRPLPALLATAAAAVSLVACNGSPVVASTSAAAPTHTASKAATSSAPAGSPTKAPATTPTASASASASASGTRTVVVYYLGETTNGPRLYRETRQVKASTAVIRTAISTMLTSKPRDPDYTSLWPKGTALLGISLKNNVVTVDFAEGVTSANAGGAYEAASLQQLLYTIRAAAPNVTGLRVLVEGTAIKTLWGHVDTSRVIKPARPENTLAAVQITSPANGAVTGRKVTVRGEATVFEATVSWQILRNDMVVDDGSVTASKGAPERGTWSFTSTLPAGNYTIKAFESSAKDGSEIHVDTKKITVK